MYSLSSLSFTSLDTVVAALTIETNQMEYYSMKEYRQMKKERKSPYAEFRKMGK